MSELVDFLRQRLAEDEEAARAAFTSSAAPWRLTREQDDFDGDVLTGYTVLRDADGLPIADDRGGFTEEELGHFARFDPARALADVEAKRRLVELHGPATLRGGAGARYYETTRVCRSCEPPKQFPETAFPCQTLRLLALPYANHDGFKEEWRV